MRKILILEDEPLILKYLTLSLSNEYQVFPFSTAIEAKYFFELGNTADYILCDYMLGSINGIDFLNIIIDKKYLNNIQKNFIFITAFNENEIFNKLLSTGCRIIDKCELTPLKVKEHFEK